MSEPGGRNAAPGVHQQDYYGKHDEEERRPPPTPGVDVHMPPPGPRPGSVQRLLEKEGHDARNVISWRVPNQTGGSGRGVGGSGGCCVVDARAGAGTASREQREGREMSREKETGR